MKKQEFIKQLAEELEFETEFTLDTNIKNMDEWDSMSVMILIGFVSDTFNVTLNNDDISLLTTFGSLTERIGKEKFD
tara:strand:+ start:1335 stop:1565 length:231 start_codon:yes stop_codon:yes gene_type:complete